ncbi:carbamate kinase [bacterium]|nr:carbamate kinase [bacterium]
MTPSHQQKPILLIALGGNTLIQEDQRGTIGEQLDNLRKTIRQIARLSAHYRIIITHGNGPQVGNLLLQQESCDQVPKLPLEILVAQTEGQIGYMIESTLDEELMTIGVNNKKLVTLITYVVVDQDDPAFQNPTKPIGPVFSGKEAKNLGYPTIKTKKGYRRVVASPNPVTIIEKREIRTLIDLDFIIICCGGGGIPVIRDGRGFHGVHAVIDKDLASACLAQEVNVDIFIITTDVAGAMIRYNQKDQTLLKQISVKEAEAYIRRGHFKAGSMLPKMTACTRFIHGGGKRAIITSTEALEEAVLNTDVGTQIVPEQSTPPV